MSDQEHLDEDKAPETGKPAAEDASAKEASIFYQLKFWVGMSILLAVLLVLTLISATIDYRHDHHHGDHGCSIVNNYYYQSEPEHIFPPVTPYPGTVAPQGEGSIQPGAEQQQVAPQTDNPGTTNGPTR